MDLLSMMIRISFTNNNPGVKRNGGKQDINIITNLDASCSNILPLSKVRNAVNTLLKLAVNFSSVRST